MLEAAGEMWGTYAVRGMDGVWGAFEMQSIYHGSGEDILGYYYECGDIDHYLW
jgi:hypothetical protein